jgi:hypothetical protein
MAERALSQETRMLDRRAKSAFVTAATRDQSTTASPAPDKLFAVSSALSTNASILCSVGRCALEDWITKA